MRTLSILLAVLAAVVPAPARAGGSSPVLSLTAARAFATTGGVRAVDVHGAFNFEDVVQGVFPAGLVVVQGTHFARFDQAGAVVDGIAMELADGLLASEVPTLLARGAPAAPPAALSQLRPDRLTVVLPPGFTPGAASVVLYALHEGIGYASNALDVVLP
jgi:hypothetical protein